MKELTTKTVRIIQQSLHTAERVLTGRPVPKYALAITNSEARDAIDELDHIKTESTADATDKVVDMVETLHVTSFVMLKGWTNAVSVPPSVYNYTLDEYRAAVRHLGIPGRR